MHSRTARRTPRSGPAWTSSSSKVASTKAPTRLIANVPHGTPSARDGHAWAITERMRVPRHPPRNTNPTSTGRRSRNPDLIAMVRNPSSRR
ncbi:hypothetical protein HMPREF9574_01178 [Cutibacterium acnes HL074PA1]|nr:hypothetical protein HMPREF9574_01178 [Cutibacterium acnes HL074PA1]